ncbi:MAG: glycine--tRNA ligase subunit beta [Elusimicrobia bacterium RIFOXYD2_FULL_34_30]|nr:MAG: glycine--tRNA ligase subunit beta [Elusimicrobia bacterium RIFOXYD2_FULL_34_30]
MNRDILLEIGTEEIPSGYINPVIEQLKIKSENEFRSARLEFKKIDVWATLRRLVLYVTEVSEQQLELESEISGPTANVAYLNGQPTQVALGFAKKYGVDVSQLKIKNERIYILIKEQSLKTENILSEIFIKIISSLTFPKTMVWEPLQFRFARPIRWIAALYGKKVIKFQIADVKSSNCTYIRYFKKIKIGDVHRYISILRNKSVIVEPTLRIDMLKKAVLSQSKGKGEIVESEDVFNAVNNMIEFPTAILCKFDEKFLNLPEEIIISTLKKQKAFVVIDSRKNIIPYFVGVKDGISINMDTVREGFEKVVTARLEDAEFYFNNDIKVKLEDKFDKLKDITFQEKLGTIFDKVRRIEKLAEWLSNNSSAKEKIDMSVLGRICHLCKIDLSAETVSEFPEFQGVFGRICARRNNEEKLVSDGIEQHWWPINYDGKIPESYEASVISIADKVDTLVGDFAIGLCPTGSNDPYGLRRLAFGIIRIAIEKEISFSIKELIIQAISYIPYRADTNKELILQIEDFLKQRLTTYLSDKEIKTDEIDSVLSVKFENILDSYQSVVAVNSIRKLPDFEPIAVSFKRIGNILKQAKKENKEKQDSELNIELLKEQTEKELYEKFLVIRSKVENLIIKNDYKSALKELVSLRVYIDNFFEKVLIMDKDESVKNNRLALIRLIFNGYNKIADFSKIVVEKEQKVVTN